MFQSQNDCREVSMEIFSWQVVPVCNSTDTTLGSCNHVCIDTNTTDQTATGLSKPAAKHLRHGQIATQFPDNQIFQIYAASQEKIQPSKIHQQKFIFQKSNIFQGVEKILKCMNHPPFLVLHSVSDTSNASSPISLQNVS